jgi:hypothetical protein
MSKMLPLAFAAALAAWWRMPHVTVARGRPVAIVHTSALVVTWAGANPRGKLFGRWKSCRRGTDLGNDLLLKELKLLQCHLQELAVDGLEIRARVERITQLFRRRGPQPLMGQSGQSRWIGFPVGHAEG